MLDSVAKLWSCSCLQRSDTVHYNSDPSFVIYFSGDVFGSTDFFYGLGIFFDTYSNHNGEHQASASIITHCCCDPLLSQFLPPFIPLSSCGVCFSKIWITYRAQNYLSTMKIPWYRFNLFSFWKVNFKIFVWSLLPPTEWYHQQSGF